MHRFIISEVTDDLGFFADDGQYVDLKSYFVFSDRNPLFAGPLEKTLGDYYIFEIDDNPVACVALHVQPDGKQGELACLYVSPVHEHMGIGRTLIQFVERRARELGLTRLYALSTQAFTYFQSKGGFQEGTPDDLPPSRAGGRRGVDSRHADHYVGRVRRHLCAASGAPGG